MSDWGKPLPIWVSRPDADKFVSKFTVPLWMFMVIGLLALFNALLWGGYGLYAFFEVVA